MKEPDPAAKPAQQFFVNNSPPGISFFGLQNSTPAMEDCSTGDVCKYEVAGKPCQYLWSSSLLFPTSRLKLFRDSYESEGTQSRLLTITHPITVMRNTVRSPKGLTLGKPLLTVLVSKENIVLTTPLFTARPISQLSAVEYEQNEEISKQTGSSLFQHIKYAMNIFRGNSPKDGQKRFAKKIERVSRDFKRYSSIRDKQCNASPQYTRKGFESQENL